MSTDQSARATPTTSMTTSSAVAVAILQHLGRPMVSEMGGLYRFTTDSVTLRIRGSRKVATHVTLTLTATDTYSVKLEKRRAGKVKDIAFDAVVSADELHQVIASRLEWTDQIMRRVKLGARSL